MKKMMCTVLLSMIYSGSAFGNQVIDHVAIAILAKDKAHTLPLYLECIEKQTWPKDKTYLYIRTNNNNDATASILHAWVDKVRDRYAGIYFDDSDVAVHVEKYGQHEWNGERFKVLGKIRQDSVTWARQHNSHYFVVDCDNFIQPHTLEALLRTNLPIVAPLLHVGDSDIALKELGLSNAYSNYHAAIDGNGYYADCPLYYQLWRREIKGLIELPVVHCAYVVRYDVLDKISYDDETGRYEYVIFSDCARKQNIPQYLDTREVYGRITFAQNEVQFKQSPWLAEFGQKAELNRSVVEDKTQEVFTAIYKNNAWGDPESRSGSGSSLHQTNAVRAALPILLQHLNIKTLLDAPCGDCNWISQTDLSHLEAYIGTDIVEDNINNNCHRNIAPSTTFVVKNVISDPIAQVDLILCRDLLPHISFEQIKQTIKNFKKSGSKYLLTTTYEKNEKNYDIHTGYWMPLNLEKSPFNFPKPLMVIDENATDWSNEKFGKRLALWLLEDINIED